MRWLAGCLALIIAASRLAGAQVVRGVVTERVSGAPLRGVLVSVASAIDSSAPGGVRHALSNARGEFAVSLPRAGTWVLSAKRIGVARYSTAPFGIRTGETRRFEIALEPFEFRLPEMRVAATNLCIPKQDQLRSIVALWDEARTALIASEVTGDEQRVNGWLSEYTRSLEPRSLRILQDQRTVAEGLYDRPIRSISGDSLARAGFWRKQDADTMVFHGPDAEALLSDAFQSSHCFELIQGSGDRRGLQGLRFRPRQARIEGGITGTIWLDGANFELRFVEFRYTNLITIPPNPHLGGEVHFHRHDSGAWVVRRWFVRMPQFPEVQPVAVARAGVTSVSPRAYVYRVIEQGGGLFLPHVRTWERPGSIEGTVMDSTGRQPLRGTLVSLSGTPYSMEVDSSGRFRFDSLPSGAYTLLASHADYAALGQIAADEPLNVVAGATHLSRMVAIRTSELLKVLCDGKVIERPAATVRITLLHDEDGQAVARQPVWLRWPDPDPARTLDPFTPGLAQRLLGMELMTDPTGAATFCGVPSNARLEFVMLRSDDNPDVPRGAGSRIVRVASFWLKAGEVASRMFRVVPPE